MRKEGVRRAVRFDLALNLINRHDYAYVAYDSGKNVKKKLLKRNIYFFCNVLKSVSEVNKQIFKCNHCFIHRILKEDNSKNKSGK